MVKAAEGLADVVTQDRSQVPFASGVAWHLFADQKKECGGVAYVTHWQCG